MDLYLPNHFDSSLDEFNFKNLYYLSTNQNTQRKRLGKDSSYRTLQKYSSQKDLITNFLAIEYSKLQNMSQILNYEALSESIGPVLGQT